MPVPQITITPAGFAAIVNAEHTGTAPVKLTHVGLTPQHFDVATVVATLPGEAKRLTTFGGQAVSADTLHLNVRDDTADAYTLRGFGLYLQDGTLFAVYSQPAPIMEKAAAATMLLATDIRFAKVNATSIEVGDIDFVNPPATTTRAGVVRLSTDQEADAGSDAATALTPRGLAGYINRRFGNGAPSVFVKGLLGLATAALFRTELGLKSAALRDEGHGNSLNADMLDGAHGDYYLEWRNFTGVPTQFNPAPHEHTISQVTGLADALNGKANKAGDTFSGPVIIKDTLLRVSGWAGAANDGVVYFGAANSYMLKSGAAFHFSNADGGFTAILNSGGSIWSSGNFDPNSKLNKAGDTMSGALTINTGGGGQLRLNDTSPGGHYMRLGSGLRSGGDGVSWFLSSTGAYEFVDPQNTTRNFFAINGSVARHYDRLEAGINKVALVAAEAGRTGFVEFRHTNGVRAGYIGYSAAGGLINCMVDAAATGWAFSGTLNVIGPFTSNTSIGSEGSINSNSGGISTRGAGSAMNIYDRNFGDRYWSTYSADTTRRWWLNGVGDLMTLSPGGALWTSGGYDSGSSRKLKDIEGPIPYGLAEVEQMEIVVGRYKPEYNPDGRRRLFLITENLAELMPETVNAHGFEFNGELVGTLKLEQLLPVAFSAIQELSAMVRQQGTELAALKAGG